MNAQEKIKRQSDVRIKWGKYYRLFRYGIFKDENRHVMRECRREAALERKLEAAQRITSRDIEALSGIVSGWRDYANGHYCMTYNVGMSQGLKLSADALEAYVNGMKQRNTVKDLMR